MNPSRVDFLVDLAYGVMIFVSIALINIVGTEVGIAFGLGVLISYVIHVVWKMARFDPEWMTAEVTQNVEDTLTREVDEVIDKLETVNERVDRRPRTEEVEETVDEKVDQKVDKTVDEKVDETVDEKVDQTVDEKVGETVDETVEEKVDETVEEKVDETVEEKVEQTVDQTVDEKVEETVEEKVEEIATEDEPSPGDDRSETDSTN